MSQQGIWDKKQTPLQAIESVIAKALRAHGGALPGIIVSYEPGTETATVKPGVHRLVPDIDNSYEDVVEELPAVQNVPVMWPRGRGLAAVGSLVKGDSVLMVCLDRDASVWRKTGEPSEPDDARIGSWQSCVAIPGLIPNTNPFPVPTDAAALASKLDAFLRTISALTPAVDPSSAAVVNSIIAAAITAVGGSPGVPGLGTVGSTRLKVDS